jgi:hypothetical protein
MTTAQTDDLDRELQVILERIAARLDREITLALATADPARLRFLIDLLHQFEASLPSSNEY